MSDFSFGGGGSIGSFGSCDGCDGGDCDCDCDGCDCDCGDCSCPDCDCDCDCCKNCCDEVCFRCCATVYNCTVNGCSDYVCCCFFQTKTTTTDGRQRSNSNDSDLEYEMYNRSPRTSHLAVVVTSPPDITSHAANGVKGPKLRKGGQKDPKDQIEEDELSAEELERRVMAGEENWQPENEQLQQLPEGDLGPTAPPCEIEVDTIKSLDDFGAHNEATAAHDMDHPSTSPGNEQSTSLLGLENATEAKDPRSHSTGPLRVPGDVSENVPEEEVPMTGEHEDALRGCQPEVEIAEDTSNYPTVDPPSYDEVVVTTQPGSPERVEYR